MEDTSVRNEAVWGKAVLEVLTENPCIQTKVTAKAVCIFLKGIRRILYFYRRCKEDGLIGLSKEVQESSTDINRKVTKKETVVV